MRGSSGLSRSSDDLVKDVVNAESKRLRQKLCRASYHLPAPVTETPEAVVTIVKGVPVFAAVTDPREIVTISLLLAAIVPVQVKLAVAPAAGVPFA